ncbi:hypothetical protein CGZ96_20680 [Enemella evansiae]|nr:hypothetical protein CGZ96_20680 [Enemella evansiae]
MTLCPVDDGGMKTWIALAGALLVTGCGFGGASTAATPAGAPSGSGTPQPTQSVRATSVLGGSSGGGRTTTTRASGGAVGNKPEDFKSGNAWYFKSPSGNIYCAINPGTPTMAVGCQASFRIPSLPKCNDPNSLAPAVWVPADPNAKVVEDCVNQGFFIGEKAKVLPYGKVLTAAGYRCESRPTGVRCGLDGTDRGFTIAREGIESSG